MKVIKNKIIVESNDKLIWVLSRGQAKSFNENKNVKSEFSKKKIFYIEPKDSKYKIWKKFETLFPSTNPEEYLKTLLR